MRRRGIAVAVGVVAAGLMALGTTAALANEGGGLPEGAPYTRSCVPLPEGHAEHAKALAQAAFHYFAETGLQHFPSVGDVEAALPAIVAAAQTDDPVAVAWLKAEVGARQPNGLCHNAGEPPPGGHGDGDKYGDDENGDKPGWDGIPRGGFKRAFLNRIWRFAGEDPIVDGNVMNVTLLKVANLPRRFRHMDDELVDQDLMVKLGRGAKLRDCDGDRVSREDLEDFTEVNVRGKLLRPSKWLEDEDGETTPTVRAKSVRERCDA